VAVPIGSDDAASVAASLAAAPAAAALVQAAAGQLPLEDIRFAGGDLKYVLLVLAHGTTRGQLEGIQPDFGTLLDVVGQNEVHGVIVSCAAEPGEPYDVYARFFGPWMGINEGGRCCWRPARTCLRHLRVHGLLASVERPSDCPLPRLPPRPVSSVAPTPADPVTGSAFCVLAPYWARRLGKQQLRVSGATACRLGCGRQKKAT
jgi:predicted PhzF superfamily epimerase YddE/YHI9